MSSANQKLEDLVIDEFYRIKEDLGHVHSKVEMFTYMDEDLYINIKSKSKFNIFKDYIKFIKGINEHSIDEENLVDTFTYDFIKFIENTSMSKTYKMPVLLAFYNSVRYEARNK